MYETHWLPDCEHFVRIVPNFDPELNAIVRLTAYNHHNWRGDIEDACRTHVTLDAYVKFDGSMQVSFAPDNAGILCLDEWSAPQLALLLRHVYEIAWHFWFADQADSAGGYTRKESCYGEWTEPTADADP